jgi:hypothetical protein
MNMKRNEEAAESPAGQPYWTHDTSLFTGTFRFFGEEPVLVRGKLHLAEEPYNKTDADLKIVPISQKTGQCTYIRLKAFVLVPDISLIVGLYPQPKQLHDQEPAIGEIVGTTEQTQMKEQEIGDGQAWYYPIDQTIVVWECGFYPHFEEVALPHDPNMQDLWTGFEIFLTQHFHQAKQISTPYADPRYDTLAYQHFLAALNYVPHPTVAAAWWKPVPATR